MTVAAASEPTPIGRPPILVLLTLCFTLLLFCMPINDFDVWWHLKHGEWIVENLRVPRTDIFSYGSLGMPYLDQHWGFQVYLWIVYSLCGVPALALTQSAIGTAAVAAGMASCRAGTPQALVALAWLLPVHVLAARNLVRPELFTVLSVALTLALLAASERRPRLLLLLPLQQVIAINFHAVAIVNVGIMGAFVASRTLQRIRNAETPLAGSGWKLEWATLGAMALAGLVSPYGVEGFLYPILLLSKISVDRDFWSTVTQDLMSPLVFLTPGNLSFFVVAFFAQILIGAFSFVLVWRDRRFDLYRLLLFATFSYLTLSVQHNVNLFALVAGAVTLWNLADWTAARPRVRAWLNAPRSEIAVGATLLILILSVVTGAWHRVTNSARDFGIGEAPDTYIHGAVQFAGREGMPDRAFVADFGQAGLYSFYHGPERMPFIDGRLEHPKRSTVEGYLFVKALLGNRAAMLRGDRRMLEVIAPGATSPDEWPAIVLDFSHCAPQIQNLRLNPDWRAVYVDRTGAVFVSRSVANRMSGAKPQT